MSDEVVHTLTTDDISVAEERAAVGSPAGRTLLVRLFRWGEVASTPQGRESFVRGALDGLDPTTIVIESQGHDGDIVGRGTSIEDDGIGPLLRADISDTTAGNDLLTLVRDKVLRAVSVSFNPTSSRRRHDGVIERLKADVKRVAVLPSGAYPSAQVLEVRSATMDAAQTTEEMAAPAPPIDLAPIHDRLDRVDEAIRMVSAMQAIPAGESDLLKRFATFGDAFMAATTDPEVNALLTRALADNITTGNGGVILPGNYIGKVVLPAAAIRRSINAFGGPSPLPDSGMSFEWVEFDAVASTLVVAEQATQKTEIATGKTEFDQKTAPVKTWAGGSDNALQLLERSSPSYRELLLAHYARQWALTTNGAFVAIIAASPTTDTLAFTNTQAAADLLRSKLFAQSASIEAAVGTPASVVLASTTVFRAFGGNPALLPGAYGTNNIGGTAQASTLAVNVSGLPIIHEPQLAAGKMITATPPAAGWLEDGPTIIEALNVAKLGRDIAIYSFGNGAIFIPSAVIVTTVTIT